MSSKISGLPPGGLLQSSDLLVVARGGGNVSVNGTNLIAGAVNPFQLYRDLAGMELEKISTNVLQIQPGNCVSANSSAIFATNATINIDMTTVGANGLDVGSPVNATAYYVYVIVNNLSGLIAGLVSASIIYGSVVVPTGYSMVRKLPFGFVYKTAWDGIPDFHLTHWPKPFIRYTGLDINDGGTWAALGVGTSSTFVDVDLSTFVPDNARIAYIYADVGAVGSAGTAYMRVLGGQVLGIAVGSATPTTAVHSYGAFWQRVTSTRTVQYKVTGGAQLSLYVLGYAMTEPS